MRWIALGGTWERLLKRQSVPHGRAGNSAYDKCHLTLGVLAAIGHPPDLTVQPALSHEMLLLYAVPAVPLPHRRGAEAEAVDCARQAKGVPTCFSTANGSDVPSSRVGIAGR